MKNKQKIEVVFGSSNYSIAFLLLLAWLFASAYFYVNPLQSCKYRLTNWRNGINSIKNNDKNIEQVIEEIKEDPLKLQLRRLVRGDEDKIQLEKSGFICQKQFSYISCVTDRPIIIHNQTININISSQFKKIVKPYTETNAHKFISPVEILAGENSNYPECDVIHNVPAVVFSGHGFAGNIYHEISETIIPLFITTTGFKSEVKFVVTDFTSKWKKYRSILEKLTNYELINPAQNDTIHCFPGGVIGLKYHGLITPNSTEFLGEYSMSDVRKFLREAFSLKYENIFQIESGGPILLLISRRNSRMFLNEKEMIELMKDVGFQVIVVGPKDMWNLDTFSKIVNRCHVIIGAHGAGLTNEIFLPNGAVMVQVVMLGLDWASNAYYGGPASDMGLHYLEYKIKPEESSLLKRFRRNDTVITNPDSIGAKNYLGYRDLYLNTQNARVNLTRFRETLVRAMELVDL